MLKFAVPAVAALGLIAFAAQSRATDAETGVPGMGWHLSQEGAMAKLAYGVENSDQLALMMTCEPGDRRLALYGDVLPASPRLIQASSRESAIDPLSGDLSDEAAVSLRDPTLREMARTGRLTVEGEAGQFQLTANAQERVLIERFFAYCGTEHV